VEEQVVLDQQKRGIGEQQEEPSSFLLHKSLAVAVVIDTAQVSGGIVPDLVSRGTGNTPLRHRRWLMKLDDGGARGQLPLRSDRVQVQVQVLERGQEQEDQEESVQARIAPAWQTRNQQ
jgi:hypothetical protein